MEVFLGNLIVYGGTFLFCILVIYRYLRKQEIENQQVEAKIVKAKEHGLFEPVSLHPVIDVNTCIKSGACITSCPEQDILGIRNGIATTINASNCIGHGACFHACPVQAISLCIGTEKRGVDLPHVSQTFETNIPGIYIAGELGGMGLIKNAVEQGKQALSNIVTNLKKSTNSAYDLIIVGAGPAGISASLAARKYGMKCLILEQDSLGGTVFTFPRSKIVMTSPMDLPLHGKVKLFETSKSELLELWEEVLDKNDITIKENAKVESIVEGEDRIFTVHTLAGTQYQTKNILLAIGRRGTPRKLNVPGEKLEKVSYRLLEPEQIHQKEVLVVGGGDSAIEAALLLAEQNSVTLSYRSDVFKRIKPKNRERINKAIENGDLDVRFGTNLLKIEPAEVEISQNLDGKSIILKNDLVYIFAGGELPTQFLEKIGIKITRRFGYALLKHQKN